MASPRDRVSAGSTAWESWQTRLMSLPLEIVRPFMWFLLEKAPPIVGAADTL
jgi:hypothetical protein